MRITVLDQLGLPGILNTTKSRIAFQAAMTPFLDKSLLVIDEIAWKEAVQTATKSNGEESARLQAIIDLKPMLLRNDWEVEIQVQLLKSPDQDFAVDHLTVGPDWRKAIAASEAAILEGSSRDDVYQSKLGYLMPGVSTFYYIDQYFHKKLLQRDSGAWYLLDKLVSAGVQNIEIKTGATFSGLGDETKTSEDFAKISRKKSIENQLNELLHKHKAKECQITISVYRKTKFGLPHDRLGFLTFRKNKLTFPTARNVYFAIGPGVDLFSDEEIGQKVASAGSFNMEDPKPLRDIGKGLECFEVIEGKVNLH